MMFRFKPNQIIEFGIRGNTDAWMWDAGWSVRIGRRWGPFYILIWDHI